MSANQSLQLLQRIKNRIEDDSTTNLVFSAKVSGDPTTFSTKLVQLHNSLIGVFKSISSKAIDEASECSLLPYESCYKPDSYEAMYIDLSSNDSIKNLVDSLLSIDGLDLMAEDLDYFKHISFYGVLTQASNLCHGVLVANGFLSLLHISWITLRPDWAAGGNPPPGSTHCPAM